MRHVVYALLPIAAFAVYQFGISVLMLIIVVTLSCMGTERLFSWMSDKPSTLSDWSAVITGLLLALTLPPGFPLWMGAVAAFAGIALAKVVFGGLGYNVFNPALAGRAFVQAAFPVAITTWTPAFFSGRFTEFVPSLLAAPFMRPVETAEWVKQVAVDGFSGATPLGLHKFQHISTSTLDLFLGNSAGSAGETSAILILLCGAYLIVRKMMNWQIPAWIFVGVIITSGVLYLINPDKYADPMFMLFSGGLMLGAMFMASDMVGSPLTPKGVMIYGLLIGFLTVLIRQFGSLSEGIMYAILLGNATTPLIDSFTQPRLFGAQPKRKAA
jgi:electron transport complex protein RnfD